MAVIIAIVCLFKTMQIKVFTDCYALHHSYFHQYLNTKYLIVIINNKTVSFMLTLNDLHIKINCQIDVVK